MKVILRKDFEKLGKVGDIVDVKDVYARNYIIPRNIGYQATPSNILAFEEEKKQQIRKTEKTKKKAESLASSIEKISLTIKMKVGEEDKLFGSVTSQVIAEALQEKGIIIDKRQIELEEPIKMLGIYDVPIKLEAGVLSKIKVWVVKE